MHTSNDGIFKGYVMGVYLSCGVGPDFRTAVNVHGFIHMFINLKRHCWITVCHNQDDQVNKLGSKSVQWSELMPFNGPVC